jgi:hypothetical protein
MISYEIAGMEKTAANQTAREGKKELSNEQITLPQQVSNSSKAQLGTPQHIEMQSYTNPNNFDVQTELLKIKGLD